METIEEIRELKMLARAEKLEDFELERAKGL